MQTLFTSTGRAAAVGNTLQAAAGEGCKRRAMCRRYDDPVDLSFRVTMLLSRLCKAEMRIMETSTLSDRLLFHRFFLMRLKWNRWLIRSLSRNASKYIHATAESV